MTADTRPWLEQASSTLAHADNCWAAAEDAERQSGRDYYERVNARLERRALILAVLAVADELDNLRRNGLPVERVP